MATLYPKSGLSPLHPGELLREDVLPALSLPKAKVAKLLGISRQQLYDILNERVPITPAMALRLGKLCGNGPNLWLNLQNKYDLEHEEKRLKADLAAIPTLNTQAV